LEAFIDVVVKSGAEVAAVSSGDYDLTTADGRLTARIIGATARHQSERSAERIRRKHQELAAAGKSSGGGTRPFGYQADRRSIDETEAAVIRDAAERVLQGESIRSICRDLTARGVGTVKGGTWAPTVLRNLLLSARISGRRAWATRSPDPVNGGGKDHLGNVVRHGVHQPGGQRPASRLLSDHRRTRVQPWNRRSYLLRGLVRCALCAKPLVARPRGDRVRRYVCASGPGLNGCGKIHIIAEDLETQVQADVIASIDGGAFAEALRESDGAGDAADARRETVRVRGRLDGLA
jgi:hypothetical protein